MGLTGVGVLLFVIIHILGNLNLFLGQDAMNAYAKALKDLPFRSALDTSCRPCCYFYRSYRDCYQTD